MRTMATLSLILLVSCPPDETPRRQIVVFHDISTSLAPDQNGEGMKIVNDIIDRAAADTEIVVIPICENTEDAPEEWLLVPQPTGLSETAKRAVKNAREDMKARVALQANQIRTQTTAANSRYSSCISPALRRAARGAAQFDTTDVVFVSDMMEECSRSILQAPVQLNVSGKRFEHAQQLVGGKGALLASPSNMQVFVFRPRATTTAMVNDDYSFV